MLANKSWTSVLYEDCCEDVAICRVMREYGNRYLESLWRAGVGDYSFIWMIIRASNYWRRSQTSRACPASEIVDLVKWWFRTALAEAGRLFADETHSDTDFSLPLHNTFLKNNGIGCINKLTNRLLSLKKWEAFAEDMPHTMAALLAPHNNSAYALQPAALSSSHNPVVQPLASPSKKPRLAGSDTRLLTLHCA